MEKEYRLQRFSYCKKKLGGGALLELSHEISYVLWLFGRPTHVTGLIQKNSELKMNTEDVVYINLIYKEFICSIELDVVSKSYDRYCKIDTDKNSYFWEYKKNSILKKNKNKVKKIYKKKFNLNESYLEEIKYFLGSKKKFSNITLKNSIDTLSTISSIRKSSVKKSSKIKKSNMKSKKFIIICARKGSKGIKDKNLQKVGNASLVEHSINTAKKIKIILLLSHLIVRKF